MNQNQMSPYKRYHNWNYCWTHGHNIGDNHNSTNCQNPASGHVWQATKHNTAGGSTKGQHKRMYQIYNYSMSALNSISQIACSLQHQRDTTYENDKTIVTSNAKNANTTQITHDLLDSGSTDHFLAINSSMKNRRLAKNELKVQIPDGNKMSSNEECNIDWPMLPPEANTGRILPNLKITL